jgi:hypothetical protein
MCNCGKKAQPGTSIGTATHTTAKLIDPPPRQARVEFEYVGPTAMTVRGPFSGERYRFHYPGARLRVHPNDASSLKAIPNLQAVPSPRDVEA